MNYFQTMFKKIKGGFIPRPMYHKSRKSRKSKKSRKSIKSIKSIKTLKKRSRTNK